MPLKQLPLFLLLTALIVSSCSSDDDMGQVPQDGLEKDRFALIVNEGGFQQANATMGLYDRNEFNFQDSFFIQIAQAPLGDIFQSMYLHGDLAYLVVNNSGTIEVVNLNTAEHLGTITGLHSPRFIEISGSLGYVTNLFTNEIQVVDLNTLEVIDQIPFPGWSEQLLWLDDQLLISCSNCDFAYLLNPANGEIADSVFVTENTAFLEALPNGNIVAMSSGSFDGSQQPSISLISSDLEILDTRTIDTDNFIDAISTDNNGQRLYFADGGVYSIDFVANSLGDPQSFIDTGDTGIYQISVSPQGELFITNARDFSGRGEILLFDSNGNKIIEFEAGILPSRVYFY